MALQGVAQYAAALGVAEWANGLLLSGSVRLPEPLSQAMPSLPRAYAIRIAFAESLTEPANPLFHFVH